MVAMFIMYFSSLNNITVGTCGFSISGSVPNVYSSFIVERLDGFITGVFVSFGKIYGVRGVCLQGSGKNRFNSS